MYKFEIFRDSNGGYRWRLIATNGYVVAVGDPRFRSADLARRAAASMRAKIADAEVSEMPKVA